MKTIIDACKQLHAAAQLPRLLGLVLQLGNRLNAGSARQGAEADQALKALRASNAESTIMAMPLALAMSVNGMFIVGLVFVPGLWSIVEYLFPMALVAFAAIAYLAFRILADFLGRILSHRISWQ